VPVIGQAGESLRFDATGSKDADGAIGSYVWGFGDGTTGSGVSVAHVYETPGRYKVTLTVTDNGGLTDTATFEVDITPISPNQPPMAVIDGTNGELWDEEQIFDGTSTSVSAAGTGIGQK
jgi:PKD repeat protein